MNPFPTPASFPFTNVVQAPWSYFKLPVTIETLLEMHRKNAAAWTNASHVAFDALSTLAQRQHDLLKTTADQCSNITRDVMTAPLFTERAAKHADAVRHIYDSSVTGFHDLGDIATRANADAVDILNARLNEGFDELKVLFGIPVSCAATSATLSAIPTSAMLPATTEPVEAQEVARGEDAEAEVEVEHVPNQKAAPRASPTTKSVKAARTARRR